jgi:hypothetical protein
MMVEKKEQEESPQKSNGMIKEEGYKIAKNPLLKRRLTGSLSNTSGLNTPTNSQNEFIN